MTIIPSPTNRLLGLFGLALTSDGEIAFTNLKTAERCDIHHTYEPIAALGWSAASPSFAKGRLPDYKLAHVFSKRPNFDDRTAANLAAVCGAAVTGPFGGRAPQFDAYLRPFLTRNRLGDYFRAYNGQYHYAIRPTGVEFNGNKETIPAELDRWRRGYLQEPAVRQMLIATVLWLYRGAGDRENIWLGDLPCDWHIADAYLELRDARVLAEWGELVARYPGW